MSLKENKVKTPIMVNTPQQQHQQQQQRREPISHENLKRFCCSGCSSMIAGFITNPIDVIKIRLQLDNQLSGNRNIFAQRYYPGFIRGILVIGRDEGLAGLFKGVGASVIREGVYSTIRIGAYEPVKGIMGAGAPDAPLWRKVCAGAVTGSIGSAIASPTDLVKVRMQGEGKLREGESARYRNVFHALSTIAKNDGVRGLWRGVGPTVQRAALLSASQIPAYDHTKNTLKQKQIMQEGLLLHFLSAIIAGFVTSLVTSPFDLVKTRIMNEQIVAKDKLVYSTTMGSFKKIFRYEGLLGFYKGFIPNWMRIGPHTLITFMIFEQLRRVVGLPPV